jgi:hypothetical protein
MVIYNVYISCIIQDSRSYNSDDGIVHPETAIGTIECSCRGRLTARAFQLTQPGTLEFRTVLPSSR